MITGFLFGAFTMLIGVLIGHVLAKPWLDKRFNRKQQQGGNVRP